MLHTVKNNFIIAILLLISFLFISCGGSVEIGDDDDPPADYAIVSGRITDTQSQEAIQGAQVYTSWGVSANSLQDGTYEFTHPEGFYNITADAIGYYPKSITNVYLSGGITITLNFQLTPTGEGPNKPLLVSPSDFEKDIDLKAQLMTNSFSHPIQESTHYKTRWQVSSDNFISDSLFVVDETSETYLTSYRPELILQADSNYYWRVKFIDNNNLGSEWSEIYRFFTVSDSDNDRMPDYWEDLYVFLNKNNNEDAFSDEDNDGIQNFVEYFLGSEPDTPDPITGTGEGWIRGLVLDSNDRTPIENAQIVTTGRIKAWTLYDGSYLLSHPTGNYNMTVYTNEYYVATEENILIEEYDVLEINFDLLKIDPPDADDGGGGGGGGGCFIDALRYW